MKKNSKIIIVLILVILAGLLVFLGTQQIEKPGKGENPVKGQQDPPIPEYEYLDENQKFTKKIRGIILPNAAMFIGIILLLLVGTVFLIPVIPLSYEWRLPKETALNPRLESADKISLGEL